MSWIMGNNSNNNNAKDERDPLLTPTSTGKYYFLKDPENHVGGTTEAVRDSDGGQVHETLPEGATEDEFAPRVLGAANRTAAPGPTTPKPQQRKGGGLLDFLSIPFKVSSTNTSGTSSGAAVVPPPPGTTSAASGGKLVKMRKAPVKIEPKVFFANERTFLAWLHCSIMLAGASIAILAFTETDTNSVNYNPWSQLYGIVLLPVAMAFIVYAMYQYARRAYMIRNRHPGPYEDTVGPTVLGIMLMLSIVAQFAIKLYSIRSW